MNLLSELPFASFLDFSIRVDRIKSGWMDLVIGNNGKHIDYRASYLTDPLNDLLYVTASSLTNKKAISSNPTWRPQSFGKYFLVNHDLEGSHIYWLVKYVDEELTLVIWDDDPTDWDTLTSLAEYDFDREKIVYDFLDDIPDLSKGLAFALKGNAKPFVVASINAVENLSLLSQDGQEGYDGWGFKYSVDNLNILKDWIQTK